MTFEIDLNETPSAEEAATCGTCGRVAGGERVGGWGCSGCGMSGGGRRTDIEAPPRVPPEGDVAQNGYKMCLGTNILALPGLSPINNANFLQFGRAPSLSRASHGTIQFPSLIGENVGIPQKMGIWPPHATDLNSALRNQSEVYLRALREFINQRGGFLSEGWSVDFFYCQNNCKTSAVYCSPDGIRFDSMDDVARHLELQQQNLLNAENINNVFASLQRRLQGSQVRKQSLIFSRGSSSRENQSGGSGSFQDVFPLQFEDLFIISLGIIDSRPSYHNTNQIWPVGYRSFWHDNISGSIFISEVLDGGDSGPIFRVRRYSCSAIALPVGSTVLSRRYPSPCNGKEKVSNINSNSNNNNNNDNDDGDDDDDFLSIQMMLKEDTPPNLGQIDFAINSSSNNNNNDDNDCIGEFSVESRSSFLAWQMASRSLIHACHVAYKQKKRLQFFCKHDRDKAGINDENIKDHLSRFCCRSSPIDDKIPEVIKNDTEFEACGRLLIKWLQLDRFGLDVEFVQEYLEQLPAINSCSGYLFLNKRGQNSGMLTIKSGFLLSKRKCETLGSQEPDGFSLTWKRHRKHLEDSARRSSYPLGKPFSKLPPCLVGDVLQGWEFLWRFSEVLGLEEPFSLEELENELVHPWLGTVNQGREEDSENINWTITSCTGIALKKSHISLLRAVVSELVLKVAAIAMGKKKDSESSSENKIKFDMLQINELTWPELARRFILVFLLLEGNLESAEINSSLGSKIFHCLQGDGGILCGSLTGVAGMEADALLLAEAQRQIFGSPKNGKIFTIDQPRLEAIITPRLTDINDEEVPEWAQALEPVRKLPTNVGARIRNCVYHALELNPPEWAIKILHHSISREVYKGNAAGPTKRAVVSVLSEITGKVLQTKSVKREKPAGVRTFSDLLMKQCRIVLRRAAAEDDKKVFCNLLGKTIYSYDNDGQGLLGSPGMVSRPLDFRVIDFRLAAGAYAGSHEAFLEDVCEMWSNIRSIYSDRSDLVNLVGKLSEKFKDLYEREVLLLAHKLPENSHSLSITNEAKREMDADFVKVMESSLPKAPWEDGICKLCGVDRDDDNVLLCDICDSEYHTYCLNPPLDEIPDGNWYCPSCVARRCKSRGPPCGNEVVRFKREKIRGERTGRLLEILSQLAQSMGSKEYWNLNAEERTFLFKFLCDETLNTSALRDHIDHCATISTELQQKLNFLSTEMENLKTREEILGSSNESNACSEQPQGSSSKSKFIAEKYYVSKRKQKREAPNICEQVQQQEEEELSNTIDDQNLVSSNKSSVENNSGDFTMSQANNSDVTSLKHEISDIQSELEKMSVRKEFLGRDSAGRIYWGFKRPGTCSLLVDGSLENLNEDYLNSGESSQANNVLAPGWISYQSDGEIFEILEWLSSGEERERELRDLILRWQKSKPEGENLSPNENAKRAISDFRVTKAAAILDKKYCPSLGPDLGEASNWQGQTGNLSIENKMHRCDCLESIWPSKHHCFLCHKTYPTTEELIKHYDGNCINRAEEESRKGKKIASDEKRFSKLSKEKNKFSFAKNKSHDRDCPHEFNEISSKFITKSSLQELVRNIGLIGLVGSNGNQLSLPRSSSYLDGTALRLGNIREYKLNEFKNSNNMRCQSSNGASSSNNFPRSFGNYIEERGNFQIRRHSGSNRGDSRCVIPKSSLRNLDSSESEILMQLKMNLLDMDAALPEEAVRPSMAQLERRSAWCSYVKSAGSIYEMVQASIVLENMIRADYLRNEWWYWSSLTAAANISTLSALALRLSTLDTAIIYEIPSPAPDLTENLKSDIKENEHTPPKPDKGKEKDSANRKAKANKRRKESES